MDYIMWLSLGNVKNIQLLFEKLGYFVCQ